MWRPELTDDQQLLSLFDPIPDSALYGYKLPLEKLKTELAKFGLTPNQCKIYIFLGKYGSKTAPDVSRALKIQRTEAYQILNILESKGIVSATFNHPIRFSAVPLDRAIWTLVNTEKARLKTLETEKNELVDLWNKIPEFKIDTSEVIGDDKFQMLKGTNPIAGKINEMIANAQKSFLILGSEKHFMRLYHSDALENLYNSKVDIRLLTSCSENGMHIFRGVDLTKIKMMPDEIKNLCFIVKDNDELLLFMRDEQQSSQDMMAMWTDSVAMTYTISLLFNHIWESSKSSYLFSKACTVKYKRQA